MIRRLEAQTEKFLGDLASINRRLERAQLEVTSGRRLNRVSDDPDQVGSLLQLRTELSQTEQIRANLGRVKSEVDAAEQSLQAAVSVLERAAVLGMQGASSTRTGEQRLILADEVENLLEQMAGLSRTKLESRFIFSGNLDDQAPYTLDLSQADPVSVYQGGAATREVMHPAGTRFGYALSAEEIFDNPDASRNVFDALKDLRLALRANDQSAIQAAYARIETAEVHLNSMVAAYGVAQNQIAEAIEYAHRQELRLKSGISGIEDADLTESILAMNQASYQREVAMSAQAKLPKTSLFDYLG